MKKILIAALVFALLVGVVILQATRKDSATTHSDTTHIHSATSATNAKAVQTSNVTIANFQFSPAIIKVKKGTTVTWTNKDGVDHTVTTDTMPGPGSSSFKDGATYSYTFSHTGTISYHCDIHEDMKGTVIVSD